jgi:hypothetical protein
MLTLSALVLTPCPPLPFGRGGTKCEIFHLVPPLRMAERGTGGEDWAAWRRGGQRVRTEPH